MSMALLLIFGFLFVVFGIPLIIAFIWWQISFNHKAWIARQVGENVNDVVWYEDKFKVRERDGYFHVIFKRQVDRSQSFPGSMWTKILKNKSWKFTPQKWSALNMSKHLGRGLFLYQTTEGEYHPLSVGIGPDGKPILKILPQDNRAYMVHRYKKINEATLDSRKQMFIYLGIVGGIVILGVAFVLFLVYLAEVQTIASNGGAAGKTAVQIAQGAVGG